ncbi:MAG: hypothetical protein JXR91_03175 [Deltaproteobacteria bacterium]|nr:hypothetical protein [Deltaproteobacteria bacterium]
MIKRLSILIVIIIFFLLSINFQKKTSIAFVNSDTFEDIYYLPPSYWLKILTAGYNEAAADIIWTKAVVYFASSSSRYARLKKEKKIKLSINYTYQYVKTVVDLDNHFLKAYLMGAQLALFHQGLITEKSIDDAENILIQGGKYFPDNGQIFFDRGFLNYWDRYNILNKKDKEKKKLVRQIGAKLIKKASIMQDAPPYAANLAINLLKNSGFTELTVEHLKTQLFNETNPQNRKVLELELQKSLGQLAKQDIKLSKELYTQWDNNFSYIPFDIFSIIAPPEIGELEEEIYFKDYTR